MQGMWTIGHSTRSIDELIDVLETYDIELVVDVRRFPGSRRLPQFASDALEKSLAARSIAYWWVPSLGGRRRPQPDSLNAGWRHPAFRGYADYIGTDEFADGLFELMMLAEGMKTAIMCAEVLWWRCHRRIISDVLVSLGVPAIHIRDKDHFDVHALTAPGRIIDGTVSYVPD